MAQQGKIITVGAGTVGSHISELLQKEQREVVIIDLSRERLERISNRMDVQTLVGHGADPRILKTAGVEEARLVLAMTNLDEVNLLAGFTAKKMGAAKAVVRSRSPWFLDSSLINFPLGLGIDLILNPEHLMALEIIRFLDDPDALVLAQFARGRVHVRSFILDADSRFVGCILRDCNLPSGVLVAVIARGPEVIIPKGDSKLMAGDKLTIVGNPDRLREVQRLFHAPTERTGFVTIAGGGDTGLFLAGILEKRGYGVKIIEADRDRCEHLSERLERAQVVYGDATDIGFMKEERVGESGVLVAVMGDDENNMMACLLAKELGVPQTVAKISRPDYASLVQKFGVSLALSPRHVMAEKVLALISLGRVHAISLLEEGRVEVEELVAEIGSPVAGKILAEISLPQGALIGAVVHLGETIIPRGQTKIESGDIVIVIGRSEVMDEVERKFRGR
jgi:trk system potassium uptake protein TrkA